MADGARHASKRNHISRCPDPRCDCAVVLQPDSLGFGAERRDNPYAGETWCLWCMSRWVGVVRMGDVPTRDRGDKDSAHYA